MYSSFKCRKNVGEIPKTQCNIWALYIDADIENYSQLVGYDDELVQIF